MVIYPWASWMSMGYSDHLTSSDLLALLLPSNIIKKILVYIK